MQIQQWAPARANQAKPPAKQEDPPPASPAPTAHQDLIDTLKRRSTLANMVDPIGMALGIVSQPTENYNSAKTIASSVWKGDTVTAQKELQTMVDRAVHPQGVYNYMYRGGQVLGAMVDGSVGGLEFFDGVSNKNAQMSMMGMADFVGGSASAVVAAGFPGVSLGFTVLAAAGKTTLVMAQPKEFSRIQKVKTVFDAAFAVSSSCLRAGVGVVPALALETVLGPGELLYMNNDTVRQKVDGMVDWVVAKHHKP